MIATAFLIGLAIGLAPWRALPLYRLRKPSIQRTFEWHGKPLRIIEAEILTAEAIDAALRGD
jgi:hypothetical protein